MATPPARTPRTPDWGLGKYEYTAAQLLPAARVVVKRASPARGEAVVDVGCGTGNAALLAAAQGACVTGVDPAPRLLEVAREQAAAQGLDVTFVPGDAGSLPLEDGAADVVLSVFGVIFAPDASAAAGEMARVTTPAGRIVLSAWVPEGAIHDAVSVAQAAVRRAVGAPAGPPPFAWHDRSALGDLFAPYGFEVTVEEQRLAFTANSPRDYVETETANRPLAVAGRAASSRAARRTSSVRACSRSTKRPTKIWTASGSRAATSWPRRDARSRPNVRPRSAGAARRADQSSPFRHLRRPVRAV